MTSTRSTLATLGLGFGLGAGLALLVQRSKSSKRQRRELVTGLLSAGDYTIGPRHRGAESVSEVLSQAVADGLLGRSEAGSATNAHKWAFFFDLDGFHATLSALHEAFPPHFMHAMAVKSNPIAGMLAAGVREHGCGLECASFQEVKHSIAVGCPASRVVYDSPCKTHAEIREALQLGVIINCDSLEELGRVASVRAGLPAESESVVGVRINPLLGSGTIEALSVSNEDSKFGVPLTAANRAKILAAFAEHPWLCALHCHVGSQGCGLSMLATGAAVLVNLADEVDRLAGYKRITTLDIGGGLPSSFGGDAVAPFRFADYAAVLRKAAPSLFDPAAGRRIITEYGRSIVSKLGWAVSEVEYVKTTPSGAKRIAIIHAGSDAFLRTCYCYEDFPVRLAAFGADGAALQGTALHDVAGPLCFGGDKIGRSIELPSVEEGDFIAVLDSGANCLSLWSRHCSRLSPVVFGYSCSRPGGAGRKAAIQLLRAAETTEEVLGFWG